MKENLVVEKIKIKKLNTLVRIIEKYNWNTSQESSGFHPLQFKIARVKNNALERDLQGSMCQNGRSLGNGV